MYTNTKIHKKERIIAHLDMDAFFAAVEEKDHLWMRGKPVAVGSDPLEGRGRGVVSTANYKAREYGIRSATPISAAWRLSEQAQKAGKPPVIFVLPNFKRYSEESEKVIEIVKKYSPLVEQASIDEAYFDLSQIGGFEEAAAVAKQIKKDILKNLGLSASVGIGPNKLVAKIASDFQKPNGLTVVTENEVENFLESLSVRKIPGIGPKTQEALKGKGVETVGDLKKYTQSELKVLLGKWGEEIYGKIRGLDSSSLVTEWEVKSIGEQETFFEDTLDILQLSERLKQMCNNVYRRFEKNGFSSFRTVVLTVRFSDFETKSRSHTLKNDGKKEKEMEFEALKMLMPFLGGRENPRKKPLRLVGVRIEKLK